MIDDDNLLENMQFIKAKTCGLLKHVIVQYNLSKQKHMACQNA